MARPRRTLEKRRLFLEGRPLRNQRLSWKGVRSETGV